MAGAEPRHVIRLLLHPGQRCAARALHPGSGRTSALMGILQLRLWHVDVRNTTAKEGEGYANPLQVLHHGQRRRKASAPNRHLEPAGRTF